MKDALYEQERIIERIKRLVIEDDRIGGLWVVGSVATGKNDKYSDIDAYIVVEKENYEQVFAERTSFAAKVGRVLSTFEVQWPNCQLYGVILENCVEVDLCYCTSEQLKTFGPYKILIDKNGDLEEDLSKRVVKPEIDVTKQLTENLDFAAYNLLHAINMLGRGEYWSSIRQLEFLRKIMVSLIGLMTRTDVDEEYRRLEFLIEAEQNNSLQKTLCNYSFESIASAIRAATSLLVIEARTLCNKQNVLFPEERFDRLLAYLDKIRSEKLKQRALRAHESNSF